MVEILHMNPDPWERIPDKVRVDWCAYCGGEKPCLNFAIPMKTVTVCRDCFDKHADDIEG